MSTAVQSHSHSTIDLLESELVKARATLQEVHPNVTQLRLRDEMAASALAAYRQELLGHAPDFYGSRRLTLKELGLAPVVHELETIPRRATLEDVLSNSLILDRTAPYLSVPSLMALASTSRLLQNMLTHTPYIFRHLDLTRCQGAQLSASQDESQTEDEVYSAPLRRIFASLEKRSILQDVRTLVLDGLPVPADLVADIIRTDRFNVNILSIRDCQHLNERKLMQVIQHAVRPTRPAGTPRVKAIYYFSPMPSPPRATARRRYRDWWGDRMGSRSPSQTRSDSSSDQEEKRHFETLQNPRQLQNEWYRSSGKLFKHSLEEGWARTVQKAEGIIAFDAVLCRGPRHNIELYSSDAEDPPQGPLLSPAIATVALGPRGCDGCHSSPEGPAIWGQSPDVQFPLLSPLPLHLSSVAAAQSPELIDGEHPVLIARCADCLTDRWCHRCNKWFCSNCLPSPQRIRVTLSPHQTAVRPAQNRNGEMVPLERECAACKLDCQHTCQNCQGDYCIEHNTGCSATQV
ncbi:hypothetical protein N7474_010561 [Penicillium riverlandense]|uniref:uncharacterized protein n=1 Tax=Penicillium riverlandense TaxID=1903569 RepID=UPI002548D43A|nr:uncharacterized protein N7474_010561 [Penicillium riverlandense]KAJ5806969.1 hypothetical protein N7474_010561 [Penicillium riverlandense]